MKKVLTAAVLGLFSMGAVSAIGAAEVKPKDAVEYRQGLFQVLKWNFMPLGAMAKGDAPFDAAVVARNSAVIAALSSRIVEGFPKGSESGNQTSAKGTIWSQWDDYQAKAKDFETAAAQLAKATDEASLKAAVGAVGKSCKACHDGYRAE